MLVYTSAVLFKLKYAKIDCLTIAISAKAFDKVRLSGVGFKIKWKGCYFVDEITMFCDDIAGFCLT